MRTIRIRIPSRSHRIIDRRNPNSVEVGDESIVVLHLQIEHVVNRRVRHFELDPSRLATDLTTALDKLPRGATSITDMATHVWDAVERGWVYATLMYGDSQVRTGHLLVAMLKLGVVVSMDAGPAAPFFAAVVVLSMLAAESFDPRLIWDYMEEPDGEL